MEILFYIFLWVIRGARGGALTLQSAGQGSFGPNEPIYFFGKNDHLKSFYGGARKWAIWLYPKGTHQVLQDEPGSSERFLVNCEGMALKNIDFK